MLFKTGTIRSDISGFDALAAVGQLYSVFDEDTLKSGLKVSGLPDDDMAMLKRVVDNAKRYYANAQSFDKAWTAEVEDDE
ncbi:MAG: hypothetical protein R6U13_11370 [Desulfatiglandaceae bacterium]